MIVLGYVSLCLLAFFFQSRSPPFSAVLASSHYYRHSSRESQPPARSMPINLLDNKCPAIWQDVFVLVCWSLYPFANVLQMCLLARECIISTNLAGLIRLRYQYNEYHLFRSLRLSSGFICSLSLPSL